MQMRLLLAILLSACKFAFSPASEVHRNQDKINKERSEHPVFLRISSSGVRLEVKNAAGPVADEDLRTGGLPLPQAFYRLRTATQEFTAPAVITHPLPATAIAFEEIIVAWQTNLYTWLCFLRDIDKSISIVPATTANCFRQQARHDYLRQFVEWCINDNQSVLPIMFKDLAPHCNKGKVSARHTVRIPLRCFTDNGNNCFPPEGRRQFQLGRRPPGTYDKRSDGRFNSKNYYIAAYLKKYHTNFSTMLDDIYAQAADCQAQGMKLRMTAVDDDE